MRRQHTLLAMAAMTQCLAAGLPMTDIYGVPFHNPNRTMGGNSFYYPTRSQRVRNKIRARQAND